MINTDNDRLAHTLGFETIEQQFGFARARAVVRPEFLNGLGIAHGGFLYSLADFTLALAANTAEISAVSASATIYYISPCPEGATVTAEARDAEFAQEICDLFSGLPQKAADEAQTH